jgi:DNA-binding beta-propeller fold protein YncE
VGLSNPTRNWQQQGSFISKVTPPGAEPDVGPLCCASWNCAWTPLILGALQQLMQPTSWDTTNPAVLNEVLAQANKLIARFGANPVCPPPSVASQVWVAQRGNDTVVRLNTDLLIIAPPLMLPGGSAPVGVAKAGSEIWVSCSGSNIIRRYDSFGNHLSPDIGDSSLSSPGLMETVGSEVWVTNPPAQSISRFRFDGSLAGVTTVSITEPVWGLHASGDFVYATEQAAGDPSLGQPLRFAADGLSGVGLLACANVGTPDDWMHQMRGCALSSFFTLWICSSAANYILNYNQATQHCINHFTDGRLDVPFDVEPVGGLMWVTNQGGNSISVFHGDQTPFALFADTSLNQPSGICVL